MLTRMCTGAGRSMLGVVLCVGALVAGGCQDDDRNDSSAGETEKTRGTRPVQPEPCAIVTSKELEEIFGGPPIPGDRGSFDCVWEVDEDIVVVYTPMSRLPGQGEQLFRDWRRQAPGKVRDVRGIGDEAYYRPPLPGDDAELHVRDGDFIFILEVAAPNPSRFKDELMDLAEIVLERGGPGSSFPPAAPPAPQDLPGYPFAP